MVAFRGGCLGDLQAVLEVYLEQKSRVFWLDPKCFGDVVGSFRRTFGVIWTRFWYISAQYCVHFGEFCDEIAIFAPNLPPEVPGDRLNSLLDILP